MILIYLRCLFVRAMLLVFMHLLRELYLSRAMLLNQSAIQALVILANGMFLLVPNWYKEIPWIMIHLFQLRN